MVDEETGVDPVANDGDPSPDELERRRKEREAGKKNGNGGSSQDRAAADDDDAVEPEMFPMGTLTGDPKTSLKNLIKSGLPVKVVASLMTAEVPLSGGLINPNEGGDVQVSYEVAKYEEIPERKRDGTEAKIVGWKVRITLRPTYVTPIESSASATG